MPRNPTTTWEMLDNAMKHYQSYIRNKSDRSALTLIDLLHVSNFKGGNASITEPEDTLESKLNKYSDELFKIREKFEGRKLSELNEQDTSDLIDKCEEFCKLTQDKNTKIRGFGPSYASALLAAYFLELIPILDRRILNGAGIPVEYDSQRQVKNISQHYATLIKKCRSELMNRGDISLRELDNEWFGKVLSFD